MAQATGTGRPCPTCDKPWSPQAFYESCAECKSCKRNRSRRNRAEQARKIAAFERFVDVLFVLARKTEVSADAKDVA